MSDDFASALIAHLQTGGGDAPDDGARTRKEIQELLGLSEAQARDLARRLISEGVLQPVKVRRPNAWGELRMTHAYQLAED